MLLVVAGIVEEKTFIDRIRQPYGHDGNNESDCDYRRRQHAYHPATLIRSSTSAANAFGSSTLMPKARTRFVSSGVRTSTGCLAAIQAPAW